MNGSTEKYQDGSSMECLANQLSERQAFRAIKNFHVSQKKSSIQHDCEPDMIRFFGKKLTNNESFCKPMVTH